MFFQEPRIIKNALHGEFKDIVMSTFKTHMAIRGYAHGDKEREFKERDSSVRYIQRSTPQHRGIELLEKWIYDILEEPIYTPEIIQITTYEEGEYYNWHVDGNGIRSAPNSPGHVRKISMSILLNDDYTGGELEIKEDGRNSEMPNTIGTIIVFPSYFTHRVKPVKKGTRYSLVAWLGGPKFR